MKLYKLLSHDLHCGLLRLRYIFVPFIFVLPCFTIFQLLRQTELLGTSSDFFLYCFQGIKPIANANTFSQIRLPILWLAAIGGSLIFNLDYILHDFSQGGLQLMYRCSSRTKWFVSKCLWNLSACLLYFILGIATVAVFAVASGSSLSFQNTPDITMIIMDLDAPVFLTAWQGILLAFILPFVTIATLNMLQMVLCMHFKPVFCFFICVCILIVSIYVDAAPVIGNGAMAIRSNAIVSGGLDWRFELLWSVIVFVGCILIGGWTFNKMDILDREN